MSGEGTSNPIDAHVGRALAGLRRRARFSRERLAARVGVSPKRLQAWEAGTERVRASELFELTRTLGAPVSAVFAELSEAPHVANGTWP